MLQLYLLGGYHLERDGQTVRLPTRKIETLLAYLALRPGPHPREKLAALLWGETGDAQARASLRNALAALNKALGPGTLATDRERAALDPMAVWVDARAFEAQARAFLAAAVPDPAAIEMGLYRGDLLPDCYDDWVGPEREALRGLYQQALLRLAQQWRAQGDYPRAMHWAEQLLAAEPTSEAAHQQLIACYLALGDRDAARRQYEACARLLHDELGVEPSPETRRLVARAQATAPAAPAAEPGSNLPRPLTSFIGRQEAVAAIGRLLAGGARLLTLSGPGGCGKTRLAIQAAGGLVNDFSGEVWWVELAALGDGALVPGAVARTLGLREQPGVPAGDQLLGRLRAARCLLVLDNCEHLIRACAELAAWLLPACPAVQMLCTSREPLGLTGETTWPVPPLPVTAEAVRLFVERAAAVRPDFDLGQHNAPLVAHICRQLDGLPLAIELAAAQTRALSLEAIVERLDDRLNLLAGSAGGGAARPRQQTLRATMDWSYDLLSPAEQALFRRLAVFVGGFPLDVVDSRPAAPASSEPSPLAVLIRLVDQSLVIAEAGRYHMLETIRQYAADRLWLSGEEPDARRRELEWCARLAERLAPHLRGARQARTFDALDREQDNFRAALRYAIEDPALAEMGLGLAGRLWPFWAARGYLAEGRQRLDQLLSQPAPGAETAPSPARAAALLAAGGLAIRQGDFAGARPLFEASLRAWQALGDPAGIAAAEHYLGWAANSFGDYALARQFYMHSLATRRALGPDYQLEVSDSLANLGMLAFYERDLDSARAWLKESVELARSGGEPWALVFGLFNLGSAEAAARDFPAARAHLAEALVLARRLKEKVLQAYLLEAWACLAVLQAGSLDAGRQRAGYRRALRLFAAAGAARGAVNSPIPPQWRSYLSPLLDQARHDILR